MQLGMEARSNRSYYSFQYHNRVEENWPGLIERTDLREIVDAAWRAYDNAARLPSRVEPAAPILFFGDLDAYRASEIRVLTVGVNPSNHQFPSRWPFLRFPLIDNAAAREPDRYIKALSAYFHGEPYLRWLGAFKPLLEGIGASYSPGAASTALHTDIGSPVATNPTWTKLRSTEKAILETEGGPLWHRLLEALNPKMVVLSVAKRHLARIEFEALSEWKFVHTFEQTGSGEPRSHPYKIETRWYWVGGQPSLFVFGQAAQTPFGRLHHSQRREAGAVALEVYRDGP